MMAFLVVETYIGLFVVLAMKTWFVDMTFGERAVVASIAEMAFTTWHIAVIIAVMRDCKRRLVRFFGICDEAANRGAWCCLRTGQTAEYMPMTSTDAVSPTCCSELPVERHSDEMPDIAELRYHINPFLCKRYLGRDDGNYGICYCCC